MKIRNLLVLAITIAVATLCAQAQERDGPMTFTDYVGQSITISSFGTVLSFKRSQNFNSRLLACAGTHRENPKIKAERISSRADSSALRA